MTTYSYKDRTLRHRQMNRRYRQLVFILCAIIIILFVLLMTGQTATARADELTVTTYRSVTIKYGDTLWSLAEEYKLPSMDIKDYISEVKRINHLDTSCLISGQSVILPVYSQPITLG